MSPVTPAAPPPARKSLVVLPTYNEAASLDRLLCRLARFPVHLLFVDDNSTDGTREMLRRAACDSPERVFLIERAHKMGLGSAYVAGFAWALARDYERIIEMDADYSHDPEDIPRLLLAAETYDLVVGSRYCGGVRVLNWALRRLMLSVGAAHYVRLILGLPLADPTSGFKCFRRQALETINPASIRSNGYSFQIEVNYRAWSCGLSVGEIPIIFTERADGESKMSGEIVREALWVVWKLAAANNFRRRPRFNSNREE